jgi:hypothetical protein
MLGPGSDAFILPRALDGLIADNPSPGGQGAETEEGLRFGASRPPLRRRLRQCLTRQLGDYCPRRLVLEARDLFGGSQDIIVDSKPFKQVVEEALRAGLSALEHPSLRPYRLQPRSLGQPLAGTDLVKALALSDALEDESLRESPA